MNKNDLIRIQNSVKDVEANNIYNLIDDIEGCCKIAKERIKMGIVDDWHISIIKSELDTAIKHFYQWKIADEKIKAFESLNK